MLGMLPMFDPPRDDSKATIDAVKAKGVSVKMITGDDTAIAIETARQLGMGTNILTAADVFPKDMDPDHPPAAIVDTIEKADGFARVFPEHKYAIVKALQSRGPPGGDDRRRRERRARRCKQADCGTAVSGATDAARGAAALILTAPGLSVIEQRHRRGAAHLRAHHHLHDLPRRADHDDHVPGRAVDRLPRRSSR